jgi:signal transduction histidine kinase
MSESQTARNTNELARLQALISEYEAKLTEAAALVARVRHEINNPLAALLGQAQLLLREELDDRSRKRAETIEQQAKRIQDIVAELRGIQSPVAAMNRQDGTGN